MRDDLEVRAVVVFGGPLRIGESTRVGAVKPHSQIPSRRCQATGQQIQLVAGVL